MSARLDYHSNSDQTGRCAFTLCWPVTYSPGHPEGEYIPRERAQCYHADPREYGFPRPEEVTE